MFLPQIALTALISTNGGWYDVIAFTQQGVLTPLSLVGISWTADLKSSPGMAANILALSSAGSNPTLVNGGISGLLSFNVPPATLAPLTPGLYLMDIIAFDSSTGITRNLFEAGPANVTIEEGITR